MITYKLKGGLISNSVLFLVICIMLSCMTACKSKVAPTTSAAGIQYNFPIETEAADIISKDNKEHFFGRIMDLDRHIQMKRSDEESISLKEYTAFLKSDITSFTSSEKDRMQELLADINRRFEKIGIHVNLDKIDIIKTNGLAYGPQAFFTREDAIFVPKEQLNMPDDGLRSVMLHEIFHIVSRYDHDIKKAAYALIGFSPLSKEYEIENKALKNRILLNPDGLDNSYGIELKNEAGASLMAVPVLYSKHKKYNEAFADYFDYIYFDLYTLNEPTGKIEVKEDLGNTIPSDYFNNFFEQISDNTQYIIHPDEIMADNFMLMVNAFTTNEFDHFSESGKVIINKLHQIFSSDN